MKKQVNIFLLLALAISFLAYGCTASAGATIGKQQNQKSSTSTQ